MMHEELHSLLPDAVYSALDSNAHLSAEKHFKLQEACKKSSTSALFDPATGVCTQEGVVRVQQRTGSSFHPWWSSFPPPAQRLGAVLQ